MFDEMMMFGFGSVVVDEDRVVAPLGPQVAMRGHGCACLTGLSILHADRQKREDSPGMRRSDPNSVQLTRPGSRGPCHPCQDVQVVSSVTHILTAIEQSDLRSADELLTPV